MYKVGVIGGGFVGGAVAQGFSLQTDLKLYDKYKNIGTLDEVIEQDFIFICVPTNTTKKGGQDLSIVEGIFLDIKEKLPTNHRPILIPKSTILPGTCRMLSEEYKLPIVFNPEFLTARCARLDFINSARIILGGDNPKDLRKVEDLFLTRFGLTPIYKTTWEAAELVKYMANNFFALKIAYVNEMYDICQKLGVEYDEVKNMWLADGRIGNSHHQVPGHDGDRGFGGPCFPKDLKTFITWAEGQGMKVDTMWSAHNVNQRIRKNIDWVEEDD
jgi:nucleotide sugar dehydrogenase